MHAKFTLAATGASWMVLLPPSCLQLSGPGLGRRDAGSSGLGWSRNTAVLCLALRLIQHDHPGALSPKSSTGFEF